MEEKKKEAPKIEKWIGLLSERRKANRKWKLDDLGNRIPSETDVLKVPGLGAAWLKERAEALTAENPVDDDCPFRSTLRVSEPMTTYPKCLCL